VIYSGEERWDQLGKPWIDIKRPDIYNERTIAFWTGVHAMFKNSPIEVAPNGAFHGIEALLVSEKPSYLGGGFQYKFWFNSVEDRAAFLEKANALFPSFSQCEMSK